ncbi:MAG: prenyltransferase [Bdellovibrionales bacterium]|nr:prenyltransferase [Bdellovibrionales bacterium]
MENLVNKSERYVTVADQDPRLASLLDGVVSDPELRPILMASLNPVNARNEWTFEMVPLATLERPSLARVWLSALRPDSWVLSLGPMIASLGFTAAWMRVNEQVFQPLLAVLTVVGIMALHASINLFGDYQDHKRGWDRVRQRAGARVIARGWLRARDVHRAAWGMLGLAALAGAGILLDRMSSFEAWNGLYTVLILLPIVFAALAFAVARFGFKYRGFAEIAAWFMFGPLLTGGFFWAMTGAPSWKSLVFGSVFGSLALLSLHLKNFERILVDGQAGIKTWPVRAGFDASKTFTYFCLGLLSFSMATAVVLADPVAERLIPALVLAFGIGPLAARVRRLESPLAGKMRDLHRTGLRLAWMNLLAFSLGDILRLYGDALVGFVP